MVDAIQRELDTLRKIVLELTQRDRAAAGTFAAELAQLRKELREDYIARLEAQAELLTATGVGRHEKALLRIDSIEKAIELHEDNLTRFPTQLDREVARVEKLFEEKLHTIGVDIKGFVNFADAMRSANKEAIDKAFNTARDTTLIQQKAFDAQLQKAETSFTKEIDSLKVLRMTDKDSASSELANLKSRIDRGEAGEKGSQHTAENNRANIAIIVAMASVGVLAFSAFHTSSNVPPPGADTKRVDDLITVMTEQNRQLGQRMDALSARINALTPTKTTP